MALDKEDIVLSDKKDIVALDKDARRAGGLEGWGEVTRPDHL